MDGAYALHPKGGRTTVRSYKGLALGTGFFCVNPVTFSSSAYLVFSSKFMLRSQPSLEFDEVVYNKPVVRPKTKGQRPDFKLGHYRFAA